MSDPFPVPLSGLPVEHARPAKLCNEAAALLSAFQSWLVGKASAGTQTGGAAAIGEIMQRLVALDTKFFCDLEGGASAPSTTGELLNGAKKRCTDLGKLESSEEEQRARTEAAWLKRCSELGVTCQSRDLKNEPLLKGIQIGQPSGPDVQKNARELDRLRLERDESAGSVASLAERKAKAQVAGFDTFGTSQCESWALDDATKRQGDHEAFSKQAGGGGNEASQGTSNVAPMAVKDFRNGSKEGQFLGAVLGDPSRLRKDSRIVRVGTFHAKETPPETDPENAKLPAWAQAEMFFDCGDTWTSERCNGDDEAMWHFKWRPRLRRFNQPMGETLRMLSQKLRFLPPRNAPDVFADRLAQSALDQGSGFQSNRALRVDLASSIRDQATRDQGVH